MGLLYSKRLARPHGFNEASDKFAAWISILSISAKILVIGQILAKMPIFRYQYRWKYNGIGKNINLENILVLQLIVATQFPQQCLWVV